MGILKKIFKSYSDKEVKRIEPLIKKINDLEKEIEKLSDSELAKKTEYFKEQLAGGKTLDDILPEAFAVVREASKRAIGCTINRWDNITPRKNCRNENW